MTQTAWKSGFNESASVDVRSVSVLAFLTLLWLMSPGASPAADDSSKLFRAPSSSTRSFEDIEMETRILQALRKDAQLGSLNLGVRMSGGVAKLFGPVPTAELKARAVRIVQKMDGVTTVHTNDLYISRSADGRKRLAVVLQEERPTQTRAASPHTPSSARPSPRDPDSQLPGISPPNAAASSTPTGSGQQITLLAPEIASPPRHTPEAAQLTGNPHPPLPSVTLSAAIQNLRQRDVHFQQIRTRVEGTTVYIMPGDTASDDAMLFAQIVRRVPGVRHVIMESGSR